MTSRRPMIRTYSSNGRTSSFSEEEGSSSNGRSESRNTYLSNVRPENRSTLCSVMAQLTEDIQPSFERTLKSKAVSENCNVKFTCVVSGYPAPELKWYKDDREMDRYCGLPKYEIHRNGKTHTLHIYNCTLDDAAIYQVSASNSKGIVSCSGVLEVGDMNEYKIHQRFFSKLKQKAENKKKSETEAQSKKTVDKENIQKAKQQISPERPPRKRHVPPPAPSPAIKEAAAVEQQGAAGEINGVSPEVMEAAQMPFKDKEADKDEALSEKALATKKMKISNGVAAEVESSNVSAKSQELRNGGENCYDGGIGLAQFLAETLQSQTSEENQSSAEGDSSTEMALNASNSEDKEKEDVKTEREEGGERQREECERQQGREEELATEKGKEMEKLMMASQIDLHAKHSPESKQHCKAHKDLEHHNIQASISSMLHSVKDFLFGKSKKDSPDHSTNKISHSGASHAEMPPSFQLQQESNQACRPISGDRLPMEIDRTKEPQEVLQAQNVSLRRQGSRHEGSVLCADQPPANKLKFEMLESSIGQSVEMPNDAAESMEISAVPESCSPGEEMPLTGQVLTEAEAISVIGAPDCMEISSEFNNQAASDESEDKYVLSETQKSSEDKSTPTSVEAFWTLPQSVISVSEHKSNNTEVHGDILQEKESGADEKRGGPKPEVARSDNSSSEGQKAEVKFNDVPQSDINRHEIIQLSFSAEERIESCEFEAQNQVRLCSGTANVETKLSPKINELTRGSPVAAASDSLEKDELSKRQESTVPGHEERPEVRSEDSILSPILDLGRHKDRSKLADVFVPELEVKLSRKQERPEVELVEGDKMESSGEYVSQDNSSVRLPQMATVPVINVSCIDPKQDEALSLDGHSSDGRKIIETPAAPAFVVPPISVTSHDGECALKPSTQNDSAETESTVTAMRVTKQNVDNAATEKSDKPQIRKQSHEEATEKRSKENALSAMGDGFTPNVGSDGSSLNKTADDSVLAENTEKKTHKEAKIENFVSVLDYQRNHPSVDRLASKPPTHPSLSPSSLRKFMSKAVQELDIEISGVHQSDKPEDDLSGGSTPTLPLSCESSPRMKRRDSLTLIRSATPEELASGARRKIFMPRPKEDGEGTQDRKDSPYMSPSQARRAALLQCPTGQSTPPMERRSPLVGRRMDMLAVPKFMDEPSTDEPDGTKKEEKQTQKKLDPLKAPQVIRKIRAEPFPDASGHLKLWCQFFNVLLDSTIKWFRDEEEILEMRRSGGDESQAALAIILAASQDCGVYGCSISNEYGADTTDFLLSVDVLSQILLKDELEVGEEIEMTPLLFTKGLADWGSWGEKYFGRIMTETLHVGSGCAHKASRVRVIYGLDPIFESGSTCIVKVGNPVAYGTKPECSLAERNGAITKQECKVQNTIREYCKIFSAEARVSENFGFLLEVIPQYLIYRPANSVPYATVEADLKGQCLKHCTMDPKGKLITQTASEVEQKCSTFQHWIHQWTHGNLLVTQMEGVETKLTNIRVVTKSKGYQGLTESGSPEVFEQFLTHHQCNYYCGLLGLIPLKTLESLQPPKAKGSRSPLLNRKLGSSSPQMQRKGQSPQMSRKANSSPKVARKVQETEDDKSGGKSRLTETSVEMR
ncbi:Alpha-protein kinase 3 [Takifugu flavidus]|uniref:non-specific serine/threonine protein kinase n=1 Tax=Takifugu flavidus TaxID=433684 RepID=A0A5C6P9C3_9TELE|nr:Alpha-protein kinase 3 [Takifugu flavidus]